MLNKIEEYINNNYTNENDDLDDLYEKLIDKFNYDLVEIKFILYDKFEYTYKKKELRNKRDKQQEFREKLIKLDKKCIISGDHSNECQACHIIPVSEKETYNTNNGILLNLNLHNMFDKFKIKLIYIKNIDKHYDLYKVMLSDDIINKKGYENYKIYNNKEIHIRKECRVNLLKKYDTNSL
jgi:hypothetical protein